MRTSLNTVNHKDRINFLNLFRQYDYNDSPMDVNIEYCLQDNSLVDLKAKYELDNIVGGLSEFRSMVKLMTWVNDKLIGDGMCIPPSNFSADYILTNTANGLFSNCFMYAVVLNELFLSMGFCSRMVRCMPVDIDFSDCHCVVEVYSQEYSKWIVFDPANRAYYINRKMVPLNLFELREHLADQETIIVPMMEYSRLQSLLQYLTKNMIRFETNSISKYGNEMYNSDCTFVHFQSKNYPVCDKTVFYEDMGYSISHIHTSNPLLFWQPPITIERSH